MTSSTNGMNSHGINLDYRHCRINVEISYMDSYISLIGPALITRGNLAHARARGAGPPSQVLCEFIPLVDEVIYPPC